MKRSSKMGPADRKRRVDVLFRAQGGICAWCEARMLNPDEARARRQREDVKGWVAQDDPTLDHVRPRASGGTNALSNLILMHSRCNQKRGVGPLNGPAKRMRQRVLGWLDLQYGSAPVSQRAAA